MRVPPPLYRALARLTMLVFCRFSDLSYSRITSLGKGLPNLKNMVVNESPFASHYYWRHLLSLPNVTLITGVSWTRSCGQCNISRSGETRTTGKPCQNCSGAKLMSYSKGKSHDLDKGEICWYDYVSAPWLTQYKSPSWYLEPGFALQCFCDQRRCTTHPPLDPTFLLLRLVQILLDWLYPFASVAIVLNLTVIALISTSKELRRNTALSLILNMAVCDIFMGLWCILTAACNIYYDSEAEVVTATYTDHRPDKSSFVLMCPYMTFIFGVTQITSVMTSLYLTVERYLVIVYCMKPDIRITQRMAVICVCATWLMTIGYKTYGVFFLSEKEQSFLNYINFFLCTASGHLFPVDGFQITIVGNRLVPLSVFLGGFYVLIFFCTIPLYIHMYIVVRKSSTQMGVKREGALARKLALLVVTNLLFSTIPLTLAPLFSSWEVQISYLFSSETHSSARAFRICSVWLPVLLLCLNCCLNPFLLAFRHHLLKKRFRKLVQKLLQYFNKKEVRTAERHLPELRGHHRVGERHLPL